MDTKLDPRFINELVKVMSHPPLMVDVALNLLYPNVAEEFQKFQNMPRVGKPLSYSQVYEWLRTKFPAAPAESPAYTPDELFREMFKCIVAQAWSFKYVPQVRIYVPGSDAKN